MTFFFVFLAILSLLALVIRKAHRNTYEAVLHKVQVGRSEDGDGALRILQLSDLHLEKLSITPDDLYEKLKEEAIDLIALTGDFLDREESIAKLGPYLAALNALKPTYGMYAVFGNHDYVLQGEPFARLKATLEAHGCVVLQNETKTITVNGQTVNIIGIDDFYTGRSDIEKAYAGVKDGINLVLTHDPDIVPHMKDYHFDYLLSGHFHGGQIHWPKPYHLAKMSKTLTERNMIKGYHEWEGKPFYINEGLGQTGVNIRIGSKPEVTLHLLALPSRREAVKAV
ncbi:MULTISPECIES: metallophosphoesterase [Geobacillus]|uniref:metallophosphoesterase n=1 Tax=Geobacillus TaxID=129337 RepID=UPI0002AF2B14|nr:MULTISPECIES: metallophosphoesterase [Geobacillus]AGE22416.1 putative metallo-dependent phosphatase [Geobacillus sp. GHH01]OQP15630.1 metallophosphoesterase [Geobacillus zalihae]QNU25193.1 metallophosphoesterase [Geobacillus zalihae]RXS90431.1 metallophosphoesterase [Geobacillus sp. PK12]